MKLDMILSASGWRKIFTESGNSQDKNANIGEENKAIVIFASLVFANYIKTITGKTNPTVVCAADSRPTGKQIADAAIRTFLAQDINVKYAGIAAAPEIMAYAKNADGFMYISASHNPVGYNGIKFGLNKGGVLSAEQNALLVKEFIELTSKNDVLQTAAAIAEKADESLVCNVFEKCNEIKKECLAAYRNFLRQTISGTENTEKQEYIFAALKKSLMQKKLGIVCDMNGSARCVSVDKDFFGEFGINFYAINNQAGEFAHEIIPEGENLSFCAKEIERLQKKGCKDALLGYVPDCDGDRGNIVYWNEFFKEAVILEAQEVFSLSVLSELSYSYMMNKENPDYKSAVAVNGPTSMRIEDIADVFNAEVFRGEVGEANIVNLAEKKRMQGYCIPILGEGSNGGTITFPSAVRDPLNTLFAVIKLLYSGVHGNLYEFWCSKKGYPYKDFFSLKDILQSLPEYTTTGVADKGAVLDIKTKDHSLLKAKFQKIFEKEFKEKIENKKYGITSYKTVFTNGTEEILGVQDFSKNKKGGLKIIFYSQEKPFAFMWMRGSGTEPVFRIMCDVKGKDNKIEKELLEWETQMLLKADSI